MKSNGRTPFDGVPALPAIRRLGSRPTVPFTKRLKGVYGALAVLAAAATVGWLTANALKSYEPRLNAIDVKNAEQDAVLRELRASSKWQNDALWQLAQGKAPPGPPPDIK